MYADLVYQLGEALHVRLFRNEEEAKEGHYKMLMHFDLDPKQITELVAVEKIKPSEIDSNGQYVWEQV